MQRFFNNLLALQECSTATKILNELKELFRQCTESEYIRSVNRGSFCYYKREPIEMIANKDFFVERLGNAILKIIDYKKYQKLPKETKNHIKSQIAQKLFETSHSYTSSYFISEPGWDEYSQATVTGISVSLTEKGSYSQVNFVGEINFPKDLFDEAVLKPIIKSVCEPFAEILLVEKNPVFDRVMEL